MKYCVAGYIRSCIKDGNDFPMDGLIKVELKTVLRYLLNF